MTARVAVIGAGAAGLAAALRLRERGIAVVVFDKGRQPGGRMALRRSASGSFEHGAPLAGLDRAGLQALGFWDARAASAQALAAAWAEGLDVRCQTQVTAVERDAHRWQLRHKQAPATLPFEAVLVTVPQPQLAPLLPQIAVPAALAAIDYDPCWTVLWVPADDTPANARPVSLPPDGPLASLRWQARSPDLTDRSRLVTHATPRWSAQHLESSAEDVAFMLRDAAAAAVGLAPETESLTAHRWRYARVRRAAASTACVTLAPGLFYASDGCIGDGVLAAVSSGVAAAEAILAAL